MYQRLQIVYQQIPGFLKNKYVLTLLVFLVWMLFFDRHNIINQVEQRMELHHLKERKAFYDQKIAEIKATKQELLHDPDQLERLAREKYWMKRPDEDLYIVVDP